MPELAAKLAAERVVGVCRLAAAIVETESQQGKAYSRTAITQGAAAIHAVVSSQFLTLAGSTLTAGRRQKCT